MIVKKVRLILILFLIIGRESDAGFGAQLESVCVNSQGKREFIFA